MTTYTCPDGHESTAGDYCDVCGAPIGGTAAPPPLPSTSPSTSPSSDPPADPSAGPATGPISASTSTPSALSLDAPAVPAARVCPNCSGSNLPDALFCEDCGYDFTTGQLPRPLDPPAATLGSATSGAVVQPAPSAPAAPAMPAAATPSATVEWVVEVWVDPDWYAAQDVSDPCPSAGMPIVVPLHERTLLVGRTSTSRNIHPEIDVSTDTGVSRRHAQLTSDGQRWWVEDLQSANGTYVGVAGDPLPTTPLTPGQRSELPDDGRVYLGAWTRLVVRKASASER